MQCEDFDRRRRAYVNPSFDVEYGQDLAADAAVELVRTTWFDKFGKQNPEQAIASVDQSTYNNTSIYTVTPIHTDEAEMLQDFKISDNSHYSHSGTEDSDIVHDSQSMTPTDTPSLDNFILQTPYTLGKDDRFLSNLGSFWSKDIKNDDGTTTEKRGDVCSSFRSNEVQKGDGQTTENCDDVTELDT